MSRRTSGISSPRCGREVYPDCIWIVEVTITGISTPRRCDGSLKIVRVLCCALIISVGSIIRQLDSTAHISDEETFEIEHEYWMKVKIIQFLRNERQKYYL